MAVLAGGSGAWIDKSGAATDSGWFPDVFISCFIFSISVSSFFISASRVFICFLVGRSDSPDLKSKLSFLSKSIFKNGLIKKSVSFFFELFLILKKMANNDLVKILERVDLIFF